ncbi:response regulator transcription factor [Oceanobacillus kapialis]|uniref:Response regulator transcription factor n=1 Tax=Oceanobacillus kapialis TaxID=481353 RepID=A0ABW5Q1K8_9BACI
MRKVTVISRSELMDNICKILEENIPYYTISSYNILQQGVPPRDKLDTDLVIIEIGRDTNIQEIISSLKKSTTLISLLIKKINAKDLTKLFRLGFDGYFHGKMELLELKMAIEYIFEGGQYIHPQLCPVLMSDYIYKTSETAQRPFGILSDQEWKVLEGIVHGKKNSEIAAELFVSAYTVNNHVGAILRKLNVTDRTSAAVKAVKHKWVSTP